MSPRSRLEHVLSNIESVIYAPFLGRLKRIFAAMDDTYRKAADHYGFHCTGCEDNCCFTRFYHHTLLEYLFIREAFRALDDENRQKVVQRAQEVCRKTEQGDRNGEPVRLMCPLNVDELCLTYAHRPMICRLHGIPHELHGPDGSAMQGRGCDAFYRQCSQKEPFTFDRTPFYVKMAELESELRQAVGITQKIKMTVAQMIVSYAKGQAPGTAGKPEAGNGDRQGEKKS